MKTFAIYEPPAAVAPSLEERAEAFELVREGFSWGALLLGPLWLLWKRLWLAAAASIAVLLAGYGLLWLVGANEDAVGLWPLLVNAALGFFASDLHRLTLERQSFREMGVVSGASQAECELKALSHLAAEPAAG